MSAAKHFEGLAALSARSAGRRAAVKAGCKTVHFSLDGCPLFCCFSGIVATTYYSQAVKDIVTSNIFFVKTCHDKLTDFERGLSIFYILAQSPSWLLGTLVSVLKIEDILKTAFEKVAELSR